MVGAHAVGALSRGTVVMFVWVPLTVTQEESAVVSVSITAWAWLAALSVAGGRVLVGWWTGGRSPRTYSSPATASGVMT